MASDLENVILEKLRHISENGMNTNILLAGNVEKLIALTKTVDKHDAQLSNECPKRHENITSQIQEMKQWQIKMTAIFTTILTIVNFIFLVFVKS